MIDSDCLFQTQVGMKRLEVKMRAIFVFDETKVEIKVKVRKASFSSLGQ